MRTGTGPSGPGTGRFSTRATGSGSVASDATIRFTWARASAPVIVSTWGKAWSMASMSAFAAGSSGTASLLGQAGEHLRREQLEALPAQRGGDPAHERVEQERAGLTSQRHALVGRHHPVHTTRLELVERVAGHLDLGALSRRLPAVIRLRVVERVRADAGPRLLGVVGDVDEAGTLGQQHPPAGEPEPRALVAVEVGERGVADGRHERELQARGAVGCDLGGPADEDQRMRLGHGSGRDADGAAPPLERLAGPGSPHHVDVLLEQPSPPLPVDAGHLELLLAVAEAGDE